MRRARCAAMIATITVSAASIGWASALPASAATRSARSLLTRYIVKTIEDPKDPNNTYVSGINSNGEIVADYGSGRPHDPIHAFILSTPYGRSDIRPIRFPGAAQTDVYALNDKGVVVGQYSMTDRKRGNAWHGFWESHGRFHSVDYPGRSHRPAWNTLSDVNNEGFAVGTYETPNGTYHAFRFNIFTHQFSLPVVGALSTVAYSINNKGVVAGFFEEKRGPWFSYITTGTLTQFAVRGAGRTEARGINDHGLVVGTYLKSRHYHGFTWIDKGGPHGTFGFFTTPWKNIQMQGINNTGKIVGWYEDSTGFHGFVAIPR